MLPLLLLFLFQAQAEYDFLQEALALQQLFPLIDGHNDLPWEIRRHYNNTVFTMDMNRQPVFQTDITRLRKGEVGGQFWSVYVSCDMQGKDAVRVTMEQIDVVKQLAKRYPDTFQVVTEAADIENAFFLGKVASLIGMEGAHSIDGSFATLRQMYDLGARYMTLTQGCNNEVGDSSSNGCADDSDCRIGTCKSDNVCSEAQDIGITDFGRIAIIEMNRLGMLVDLSHVTTKAMHVALSTTLAPVIFSHSSARALCDVDRNVPDEVLLRVKENGGVVMVTFVSYFISPTGNATLEMVVDHMEYIIKGVCPSWKPNCNPNGFPGIGVDHVGIGSDFDGFDGPPTGLEDVSKFPYLTAELLRRGYTWRETAKILGGNLIRVFKEAEKIRDDLIKKKPAQGLLFPDRTCRSQY